MVEIVYKEKCGFDIEDVIYVKNKGDFLGKLLVHESNYPYILKSDETSVHKSVSERIRLFFQEVFLPQGYPDSVSDDYWEYQLWDSIQAFCSTLSGTLTTQAVLKGVGVGSTSATPLSAAITWILKDGFGMVGRILFAWKKGTSLDADCKKWRLFADILNDSAMCIEMFLLPVVPLLSTEVLCLSTTMKAIVGVAGGATKAATTQHQAISNNMGDVSAKDGSQETCLNLIGSIFGILLLSCVADNETLARYIFILCIITHVFANYKAVKALNFGIMNKERLLLIFNTYLRYNIIEDSKSVNLKESVFLGTGVSEKDVCGFHIRLGCSFNDIIKTESITNEELNFYVQYYTYYNQCYMIIINIKLRTIYIVLKPHHKDRDVLIAFCHSLLLGIAACTEHNIHLEILKTKSVPDSLITQLFSCIKYRTALDDNLYYINYTNMAGNRDFENIGLCQDLLNNLDLFLKKLSENGWIADKHNLPVGKWRGIWGSELTRKEL